MSKHCVFFLACLYFFFEKKFAFFMLGSLIFATVFRRNGCVSVAFLRLRVLASAGDVSLAYCWADFD